MPERDSRIGKAAEMGKVTHHQLVLLTLRARGLTNEQVGKYLGIHASSVKNQISFTPKSPRNHKSGILQRLSTESVFQAIAVCMESGDIPLNRIQPNGHEQRLSTLSVQEMQLLQTAVTKQTLVYAPLAAAIGKSADSVKNYFEGICIKLQAKNTLHAASMQLAHQLIQQQPELREKREFVWNPVGTEKIQNAITLMLTHGVGVISFRTRGNNSYAYDCKVVAAASSPDVLFHDIQERDQTIYKKIYTSVELARILSLPRDGTAALGYIYMDGFLEQFHKEPLPRYLREVITAIVPALSDLSSNNIFPPAVRKKIEERVK